MDRPILKYIGRQYVNSTIYFPMWNIYNSPRPDVHPDGSSISREALKNIGVVR